MCDECAPPPFSGRPAMTRRSVLRAMAAAPLVAVAGPPKPPSARATGAASSPVGAALARYGATLHPRGDWGSSLPAKGAMAVEPDVRALLVHHTVTPNTYAADRVPAMLGSMYAFHTGKEKAWADVAYSFFVDRFGGIWEGRTGSATAAVEGSATGGNQGSTRLCSLVGDFTTVVPPTAMVDSLSRLLAALADIHSIDTAPTATATFVSRGSNRWKKGATIQIPTITGHRRTSMTTCPGDGAYALIAQGSLARKVSALRASAH